MDAAFLTDVLREALPDAAADAATSADMPTVYIARERLLDVCAVVRDHPALQFALLVDITAVDLLPASPRFELVYHFACLGAAYASGAAAPARRLRLKARVPGDDARAPSLTPLYPAAGWLEREIYDLFGISFDGHQDLRRILTPEDWEGHPLRKDYPVQIRKDTASWEPLQLSVEEFAENLRAQREQARTQARPTKH